MREHTSRFLERLDGVSKTPNGWEARCPCRNDDQNPSLAIHERDDGYILVYCHRGGGCNAPEICKSVGLEMRDLIPPEERVGPFDSDKDKYDYVKKEKQFNVVRKKTSDLKLVKEYNYYSSDGELLFQKLRYVDGQGNKTFRQRRPDGAGGWHYKLDETPKVLYNLPAVLDAKNKGNKIIVVEGEKDADTLIALGRVATTMPGGAGKWLDIHTEALAGADVVVIADNDDAGRKHATEVRDRLASAGCDVKMMRTPEKKDITDYLESGGTIASLIPFDPTPSDSIPMTDEEKKIDDEELNNEPIQEVPTEVQPSSRLELAIEKLENLFSKDLTPTQFINRASLIITAGLSENQTLDTGRLIRWDEFLKESSDETYDWIIPGLLERRERVIVVASEGVGKTVLARQVAILSANGVHPFTWQRINPIRTLFVDLENPERIIRRSSRSIMEQARFYNYSAESYAFLVTKPDGLNLLNAGDRYILESYLDDVKPDLLVLGPLYKAFLDPGTKTSEAVAIEVVKYLDTIRTVYNCALWLEHHAPLGSSMTTRELRPFGSAVWSRWPEFGLSLVPDPMAVGEYIYDVKHFRGERDVRQWPLKMKRGKKFPFEVIEFKEVK